MPPRPGGERSARVWAGTTQHAIKPPFDGEKFGERTVGGIVRTLFRSVARGAPDSYHDDERLGAAASWSSGRARTPAEWA